MIAVSPALFTVLTQIEQEIVQITRKRQPDLSCDVCLDYIHTILLEISFIKFTDLAVGGADSDSLIHSLCSVFCGIFKEHKGIVGDDIALEEFNQLQDLLVKLKDRHNLDETLFNIMITIEKIKQKLLNHYKSSISHEIFADVIITQVTHQIK